MNLSLSMNSWRIMSLFAIMIGLYPIVFFLPGIDPGFLESKVDLSENEIWWIAFYMHITGGGIALLTGWIQFWKKFRNRYLKIHRRIGLVYWIAILILGAPGGFYAAHYANGGFPSKVGFTLLAIGWFFTTLKAVLAIKSGNTSSHQKWMIRSFAFTFAAVMLRIYLPLFTAGFGIPFPEAYVTVAWLCWVPNILFAEWLVSRTK